MNTSDHLAAIATETRNPELGRLAILVRRMERTLDEITAEAMESEMLAHRRPSAVVVQFPGRV